jgi:MFS family permease
LQVVRGFDAIQTGAVFTATTAGLLLSSLGAERFAKRRAQRTLIVAGFVTTIGGIVLLLLVRSTPSVWAAVPGLFVIGFGLGGMLTPAVNVVQSSFGENLQGEISGLSRSVSNLGSALGGAVAGTILVAGSDGQAYTWAMLAVAAAGAAGLLAAWFLPRGGPAPAVRDAGPIAAT